MTEHSKSSPTLTPTWTTWWPTTTRRPPAWRTFPPLTWGKAHIQGSTSSNTTSPRAPVHSAGWATNGGKPCTAAWSARPGARNTSGCMWYPVLISGIKPWGEKGLFFLQVIQVWLFITLSWKLGRQPQHAITSAAAKWSSKRCKHKPGAIRTFVVYRFQYPTGTGAFLHVCCVCTVAASWFIINWGY